MKMRKKMIMRVISASTLMCTVIMMTVFPSCAVGADNLSGKGNIVLEDGEVALYGSDMEILQEELESLYSELSKQPDDEPVFESTRKGKIKSRGRIDYEDGTVIMDAADFTYLADEVDMLETLYKQEVLRALNKMNTFYDDYGNIVHEEMITPYPALLTLEQLKNGILNSQTVETGTVADNLSKGKGAWVNGEYIVGNGADNQASYQQGYADGFKEAMEDADISYVYHEHTGEQSEAGSGCYTGRHEHNSSCSYHEEITGHKTCGYNISAGGGSCPYHGTSNMYNAGDENEEILICNEQVDIIGKYYDCGNQPYNTWDITCGKIAGVTIESATLVFK